MLSLIMRNAECGMQNPTQCCDTPIAIFISESHSDTNSIISNFKFPISHYTDPILSEMRQINFQPYGVSILREQRSELRQMMADFKLMYRGFDKKLLNPVSYRRSEQYA